MSIQRILDRVWFGCRRIFTKTIRVQDGPISYAFECREAVEAYRARTLFVKEEGTVAWIRAEVRSGDVFCDIGANIGLYTVMAGYRVGPQGIVYAFEPHVSNFSSLLQNISLNGLDDRIRAMSAALHNTEGYFDFNYYAWDAGSSTSQLDSLNDDRGQPFKPVCSELKHAVTLDDLVAKRIIRQPDLIKIDVDGNEWLVLQGMKNLLSSTRRPRSIQVEMNMQSGNRIVDFMRDLGFDLADRHYTLAGKKKIAHGIDPLSIPYNAIFRPCHLSIGGID